MSISQERGVAQYDRAYFKKQFEGLPPKEVAIIALRAAMRVFPVLAQRRHATDEAFWFWLPKARVHYTHVICQCFQSSAFVNSLTKGAPDAAAARAASAARDAAARATAPRAAAAARSACAAATAAARGVDDDDAWTTADDSAWIALAADDALAAAAAALVADDADARTAAILADIARIQRASWIDRLLRRPDAQRNPAFLLARPLWPKGVPVETAHLWKQLQRDLV
jgi:hypothetical protein